jgi:hypothetical protein
MRAKDDTCLGKSDKPKLAVVRSMHANLKLL